MKPVGKLDVETTGEEAEEETETTEEVLEDADEIPVELLSVTGLSVVEDEIDSVSPEMVEVVVRIRVVLTVTTSSSEVLDVEDGRTGETTVLLREVLEETLPVLVESGAVPELAELETMAELGI